MSDVEVARFHDVPGKPEEWGNWTLLWCMGWGDDGESLPIREFKAESREDAVALQDYIKAIETERDALRERLEILRSDKAGTWEARTSGIWAQLVEREAEWAPRVKYFAGSSKARESEFFRAYDLLIAEHDALRAALEEACELLEKDCGEDWPHVVTVMRAVLDNKKES